MVGRRGSRVRYPAFGDQPSRAGYILLHFLSSRTPRIALLGPPLDTHQLGTCLLLMLGQACADLRNKIDGKIVHVKMSKCPREDPVMLIQRRLTNTMTRSYARPSISLTFAVFAVLASYQPTSGQESFPLSSLEPPKPGVAESIPNDVIPPTGTPNDEVLSAPLIGRALVSLFKDSVPRTRGAQDVSLFRNDAPAVVLILTKDGALGSGSLLNNSTILTNRHVVGRERQVTVVFRPSDPSGKARTDEVVQANVIKLDVQRDLALLRPTSAPTRRGIDISTEDSIDVGTDVAAIGHPNGQAWTFTKGVVSALRPDYEWS